MGFYHRRHPERSDYYRLLESGFEAFARNWPEDFELRYGFLRKEVGSGKHLQNSSEGRPFSSGTPVAVEWNQDKGQGRNHQRPMTLALVIATLAFVLVPLYRDWRSRRKKPSLG